MVSNPRLGRIYRVVTNDGSSIQKGSRVEFLGGAEDMLFSDGVSYDYFSAEEITTESNQEPLSFTIEMQHVKSQGNAGYDPE